MQLEYIFFQRLLLISYQSMRCVKDDIILPDL